MLFRLPTVGGLFMDAWEFAVQREHSRDAVRAWAELEGKSLQMTDDLIRHYESPAAKPRNWWFALALGVRLAAWIFESWWQITGR